MATVESRLDLNHTRSEGDTKEYRLVKLSNGMECLLVSTFSEQSLLRRPSSGITDEQEDRLRKASHPDRRFTFEQNRSVQMFSEDRLKRKSDASIDSSMIFSRGSKTRTDSKQLIEEETGDEDDADEDDDEGIHSQSPRQYILSKKSLREGSSKASGGISARTSMQRPHSRQPSFAGVVSGEAGRKLSQIFPTQALLESASIPGRSSIILDPPRERPPGLRLSRLMGSSQGDFGLSTTPHSASPVATGPTHNHDHGANTACQPGQETILSPRTHRTSIRSNSLASTRAMSFVYPPNSGIDSSEISTVALSVGVGSFATPESLDGLAHFLEHMLFMGSEKYPRENEFDSVLARAGGSSNAYTDTERTVYHFSVPQMHLRDCLKVFSQFFVAPLLLPEASSRELQSIESEFVLRQNIDGCRLQEIWRETSRPDTPYAKFTCGNIQTLRDIPKRAGVDVNKALRDFYSKYYVSGNMRLVVISGEALSDLEHLVLDMFSDVRAGPPTPGLSLAPIGFPWKRYNPFAPQSKSAGPNAPASTIEPGVAAGCCFRIPPTHDMHEMQMTWQLPPQAHLYKSKPTEYIAHALGHESAGSVLAELKQRGWATGLMAGVSPDDGFTNNTGVTLFNATISLTSAGLSQWIFVAGLVFEFLGIMKRSGPVKWMFDELKEVASMQYRFHEEPDPRWMAQRLCVHMLPSTGIEKEHVLTAASLVFEYNPDAIMAVLDRLEPESVRIDLISSRLHEAVPSGDASADNKDDLRSLTLCQRPRRSPQTEKYTGAVYWVDPIPQPVVYSWRAVLTGKSTVGYAGTQGEETFPRTLSLPPRNPFISSDFRFKMPRKYDTSSHPLIGAEIRVKVGLNQVRGETSSALRSAESMRLVSVVGPQTGKRKSLAQWELGVVTAINAEDEQVLLRFPSKEGVRRWHKLDPSNASLSAPTVAKDLAAKPFSMDDGKTVAWLVASGYESGPVAAYARTAAATKGGADVGEEYDEVAELFSGAAPHAAWAGFPRVPPYESCSHPILVAGSDNMFSLWYLHDTSFRSPRMSAYLSFLTPVVAESALNAALADLFAVLVFESLNQESYMAFIVDLDFEIQVTPGLGLQLHFSGFSHKLMDLVKIVLRRTLFFTQAVSPGGRPVPPNQPGSPRESYFKRKSAQTSNHASTRIPGDASPPMSSSPKGGPAQNELEAFFCAPDTDAPKEFDTPLFYARLETLLTDYINAGSRFRSGNQVSSVMFDLLCVGTWTPDEKAMAAKQITPALLIDFANRIFVQTKVEGLLQGNADETDAQNFFKCVETALRVRGSKPIKAGNEPKLKCHTVPVVSERNQPVSGWVHVLEAVESPSHSVELLFQIGPDNAQDRVLANAIEQLMREPLYSELRTKQQLGYSVKCGVRTICGTLAFVVEITSDVHGPEVLAADVDEFLTRFKSRLEQMPQEEFILNLCGMANQFLDKPKNLGDASLRHWNAILSHCFYGQPYVWNSNVIDASLVKAVCTKSRVLDALTNWLDPEHGKRRRASVYVVGFEYQVDQLIKALKQPCVRLVAQPHGGVGSKLSLGQFGGGQAASPGRSNSFRRRGSKKCLVM